MKEYLALIKKNALTRYAQAEGGHPRHIKFPGIPFKIIHHWPSDPSDGSVREKTTSIWSENNRSFSSITRGSGHWWFNVRREPLHLLPVKMVNSSVSQRWMVSK